MKIVLCFFGFILSIPSCAPARELPPVHLQRGGKVQWADSLTYWDRNGDGHADRIRWYWGSGYAREYFDDDFDGKWDGMEHAPGHRLATGLKAKRDPGGLSAGEQENIRNFLMHLSSL